MARVIKPGNKTQGNKTPGNKTYVGVGVWNYSPMRHNRKFEQSHPSALIVMFTLLSAIFTSLFQVHTPSEPRLPSHPSAHTLRNVHVYILLFRASSESLPYLIRPSPLPARSPSKRLDSETDSERDSSYSRTNVLPCNQRPAHSRASGGRPRRHRAAPIAHGNEGTQSAAGHGAAAAAAARRGSRPVHARLLPRVGPGQLVGEQQEPPPPPAPVVPVVVLVHLRQHQLSLV